MKKVNMLIAIIGLVVFLACNNKPEEKKTEPTVTVVKEKVKPLVLEVLTKEQRDALTPDEVLISFKEGNVRFMNNDLTQRNHSEQVRKSTSAQYPKAIVLSCVDSRVPVEDVLDRGIGDIFVARVAGNFVNEDILGSMEFACKVSGAKLIMVLGHEHCGAIKATIDGVELGNITVMLTKIAPALENIIYKGEKVSTNEEYVHMVCKSNIENTINNIKQQSSILKEMSDKGEIKIIGAIYDMDNGKISYLN